MRIYTVDWTNFDGLRREHVGNKDDALKRFREIRDDLNAPVKVQFIELGGDKVTIIEALNATAYLNTKAFDEEGNELLSMLPGEPETIASHEGEVPQDPDGLPSRMREGDEDDEDEGDARWDEEDEDSEDDPEADEDDMTDPDPGGIEGQDMPEHDRHPDARKRELKADRWLESA